MFVLKEIISHSSTFYGIQKMFCVWGRKLQYHSAINAAQLNKHAFMLRIYIMYIQELNSWLIVSFLFFSSSKNEIRDKLDGMCSADVMRQSGNNANCVE